MIRLLPFEYKTSIGSFFPTLKVLFSYSLACLRTSSLAINVSLKNVLAPSKVVQINFCDKTATPKTSRFLPFGLDN